MCCRNADNLTYVLHLTRASSPPTTRNTPQTWGMVAGVGMSNSCFFLAAMLCGLYRFFALPLPSSFHLAGRRAMGELGS